MSENRGGIRSQCPVRALGQHSLCPYSGALNQTRKTYFDLSPFPPAQTTVSADWAPNGQWPRSVCGQASREASTSSLSFLVLTVSSSGRPSLVLRAGQAPPWLFPQRPARPLFWAPTGRYDHLQSSPLEGSGRVCLGPTVPPAYGRHSMCFKS